MYLNARMGTSKIAKRLNMEGISTKRNSKWRDTTITRMLKNTTYIGKLVTNQRTNTDINMCSNKALGTNFIKAKKFHAESSAPKPNQKIHAPAG